MTNSSAPASVVIALDMGGSWIKGVAGTTADLGAAVDVRHIQRWKNPVATATTAEAYAAVIVSCCRSLSPTTSVAAVVIATAGEVDAGGQRYILGGAHLGAMVATEWRILVERELGCSVTLINDAEAFVLGLGAQQQLPQNQNAGFCVIGTGLGYAQVRHGRWWKPRRRLDLLGCAHTEAHTYDGWTSAVGAATQAGGDLCAFLTANEYRSHREAYMSGLARMLVSAAMLDGLDTLFLGGGLVDAAESAGVDLGALLQPRIAQDIIPGLVVPTLIIAQGGNGVTLRGALAFAVGQAIVSPVQFRGNFATLQTEQAGAREALERLSAADIALRLAQAEQQAANDFIVEAPALGAVAERMATAITQGGRVIYVGAGTSGRIGAMDAVEIPCTYGMAPERFVAVIAGGVADACLTIEGNHEEDFSTVPDMLLLQIKAEDVVIGISASGSAFFVRSALAYAQACGAYTVLLHQGDVERSDFFHTSLRLRSGSELVNGSTRMKAGTATKKALNILSTTAMIRIGKVRQGFMIDLDCCNAKLRKRAEGILSTLTGLSGVEAAVVLTKHQYILRNALDDVEADIKARREHK